MTDAKKHAARLRVKASDHERLVQRYRDQLANMNRPQLTSDTAIHMLIQLHGQTRDALLAGAEALEAQGEWRAGHYRGQNYLIPVGREKDWLTFADNAEPGEYSAIVPEWAVSVRDNVVITGWRR